MIDRVSVKSCLIALSGIDGAGKSTQLARLNTYFADHGSKTVNLWTRGGYTPGINWVKSIGRALAGKKLPPSGNSAKREEMLGQSWVQKIWVSLAILDLALIYCIKVRWWLLQGKVVICDRYLWDTLIDFKILFPHAGVEGWLLWKVLVRMTPKPTVECLLVIPLELSHERCRQKYEPFPDTPERRDRRYALYVEAGSKHSWRIIDATRPPEAVFSEIKDLMK